MPIIVIGSLKFVPQIQPLQEARSGRWGVRRTERERERGADSCSVRERGGQKGSKRGRHHTVPKEPSQLLLKSCTGDARLTHVCEPHSYQTLRYAQKRVSKYALPESERRALVAQHYLLRGPLPSHTHTHTHTHTQACYNTHGTTLQPTRPWASFTQADEFSLKPRRKKQNGGHLTPKQIKTHTSEHADTEYSTGAFFRTGPKITSFTADPMGGDQFHTIN